MPFIQPSCQLNSSPPVDASSSTKSDRKSADASILTSSNSNADMDNNTATTALDPSCQSSSANTNSTASTINSCPTAAVKLARANSTPVSGQLDSLAINNGPSVRNSCDSYDGPSSFLVVAPPKPAPVDTLYPSPSGGFVPSPEEGQDWRLKPPPKPSSLSSSISSISNVIRESQQQQQQPLPQQQPPQPLPQQPQQQPQPPSQPLQQQQSASGAAHDDTPSTPQPGPSSRFNSSVPTRPPSLPASQETASRIAYASPRSQSRRNSQASTSFASPQLRPLSTTSNPINRNRLSGLSLVNADPSLLSNQNLTLSSSHASGSASRRPRSSVSATSKRSQDGRTRSMLSTCSSHGDSAGIAATSVTYASVKIRDFAYAESDPRHFGALDVGPQDSSETGDSSHCRAANDDETGVSDWDVTPDDDEEYMGDEGDHANLADGIYKALYEFNPVSEHELGVQPNDLVTVVGTLEGGWAIAIKSQDGQAENDVRGLIPATYLEWVSEA